MSALKFHSLKVSDVRRETADCISVQLEIPSGLTDMFQYTPGQYLTFRKHIDGAELRRSYSICSAPCEGELRVAIKKVDQGKFSTYANDNIKIGDELEVMPPMGKFGPRASDKAARSYLAFVAGSGITPVMSIMRSVLEKEPNSKFTLVYGNRSKNSIIFREAIEALKNRFMDRLSVYYVLSREYMDIPLFSGRISAAKAREFCSSLVDLGTVDEAFLCGPEDMILALRQELADMGMPADKVHMELFSSPDQPKAAQTRVQTNAGEQEPTSTVSVTLDGTTTVMQVPFNTETILDAALRNGLDLPYACKGGVCCTCRARVMEGEVEMDVNYALEHDEVEKGFVLTCQAHPRSEKVTIDFDER